MELKGAPSISTPKIANLEVNDSIDLSQEEGDFALVECSVDAGKMRGYVLANSINATPTVVKGYVVTNGPNLNVRSAPNTSSSILGKLANGSTLEIVEYTNNSWYKIKYNGGYGYVSNAYVSLTASNNTTIGYVATNGANLNVRSSASESAKILGKLANGSKITIVDTSNSKWYKIKYSSGYGYVSKQYVTLTPIVSNNSGGSYTKPNLKSSHYNNGFSRGQCTWYTWGRVSEKLGFKLPNINVKGYSGVSPHNPNSFRSHAKYWWYDNIALNKKGKGYSYGITPKPNSIIVWTRGTYGHVAFVEKVDGDRVYITESNYDGKGNFREKWWTVDQIKSAAKGSTYGYIYLQ